MLVMVYGGGGKVVAAGPAPGPFIVMYGHYDGAGVTDAFREIIPPFSVIEGTSTDANFIKELRNQSKVYAAHVINPSGENAAQLYSRWSAPFNNTLGGQLLGGYDAIAIDELHGADTNGTAHSDAVAAALQQLRGDYPNKGIYVASTWNYGSNPTAYTDQLNAVNNYVDRLLLEAYIREGNLSYGWLAGHSAAYAPKIKAAVPGLLSKTVYGLYIPQGNYVADDRTDVGFWGHLDEQFHRIRNDPDASTMPGVMFWPYYQSVRDLTPAYVARLVDHYYTKGNTSYFGDGNTTQLISNAQFDPNTSGWTLAAGAGGTIEQFAYSSTALQNDHDDFALASHGTYGLKMVRGSGYNEASFAVSGIDTDMYYTVSAWVIGQAAGQHAKVMITKSDGTYIEAMEIDNVGAPPDWITKWNEWSRIIFNFVPTSDSIRIVLSDEPAAGGTTLFWDFIELEEAYAVLRGDANGDDKVDSADLAIWQQNYDPLGENQNTFAMGDWDGNGLIDSADLAMWQQNYDPIGGGGLVVAHAPEPGTLFVMTVAGLPLLLKRKRKSRSPKGRKNPSAELPRGRP